MKKIPKYDESHFTQQFAEMSEFKVLFPSYREEYIRQNFADIESTLAKNKLTLEVDYGTRTLTVKTNRDTRDPYVIVKGEQFLKVLSRGVPLKDSACVLDDDVFCEVVRIDNLVKKKEIFEKRRERLIGKSENILKALRLLTKCSIYVQGGTVTCIGPYRGIAEVKKVILGTITNTHPVFLLKQLMVKKKLAKDENMKGESWDRYIPPIIKTHRNAKKAKRTGHRTDDDAACAVKAEEKQGKS